MKKRHLISILAVVLVLVASGCAVSAEPPKLKLECTDIADTGISGSCTLGLDSAPNGLSGYDVNFVMTDPSVADMVGETSYPPWTNIAPVFDLFAARSAESNNRNLRVVDVLRKISLQAANVDLGSIQVLGKTRGWTDMKVMVNRMEDDGGFPVNPAVVNGIVRVGPPGAVMVNSTPKGAKIFINGTDMGATTNNTIPSVPQGINIVSVCCVTNYADPRPVSVEVKSGETAKVFFKLARPGKMAITSTPEQGAMILIDGSDSRQVTNYTFSIRPDTFMVNVSLAGYYDQSSNVTVKSGFTASKNFALERVALNDVPPLGGSPYGSITIDSNPAGARVILDDQLTELQTSATTQIAPGTYRVSVKLNGYAIPEARDAVVDFHTPVSLDFQLVSLPTKRVSVNIKGGACPAPINRGEKGVIPVAVAGAAGFDVRDIDPGTVTLNGIPASKWSIEDVTSPSTVSSCSCPSVRADKIPDLSLKFPAEDIAGTLTDSRKGDTVTMTLAGFMKDGTPIQGTDCIKIVK